MAARPALGVDKWVELLYSVLALTSWREVGMLGPGLPYARDVFRFSEPLRGHAAAKLLEELISRGFAFDALHCFAAHLSEPPELGLADPLSEDLVERAGGREPLVELARALGDSYRESGFERFWEGHLGFYQEVERRAREFIDVGRIVGLLEGFFGFRMTGYRVVLLPLSKMSYGCTVRGVAYAFVAPTRVGEGGLPELRSWDPVLHELSHAFVDVVVEEHAEELSGLAGRVRELARRVLEGLPAPPSVRADALERACADPRWYVGEHVVEAVKLRIAESLGLLDSRSLERLLRQCEARGLAYMRVVYGALSRYDRSRFRSFREFFPEVVEAVREAS